MLSLGIALRQLGRLDQSFIKSGNDLVFRICLPSMLFLSTASTHLSESFDRQLIGFGIALTLGSIALLSFVGRRWLRKGRLRVFVQGAFRGNLGIIGVAMVVNAYGESVLPKVGVFFAVLTLLYNISAIVVLGGGQGRGLVVSLAKNPLVKAIFAGSIWSMLSLPVPEVMHTTLSYLSDITLPLALICIGAGLQWRSFQSNLVPVAWASAYKLVLLPASAVIIGLLLHFEGQDIGILFMMMASPSAAASYVMADQMTDQGAMAGEIVAMTTLASAITTSIGLYVLASLNVLGL